MAYMDYDGMFGTRYGQRGQRLHLEGEPDRA